MKSALRRAIYYDDKALEYNIVKEFVNEGEVVMNTYDFFDLICEIKDDLDVVNLLGNENNIFYDILDKTSNEYLSLRLDKVGVILFVTRYDQAIKITTGHQNNSVAIIKFDSVLAELRSKSSGWISYGIIGMGIVGIGVLCSSFIPNYVWDYEVWNSTTSMD